ncbi:chorismate synthase [Novimethylophilus kurashikiensis]|uniref:Chorismate synthase n=1 Tax=Novimethylophilus kurashikiensis TaxID=1825523 RepID=A0A2R5F9P9_9PROT|nr:hypothetical protein [Novimethylophilus kurashikiensis]GBG14268.1 chorismate synthase [Novimethylophilus kurashikiensis]
MATVEHMHHRPDGSEVRIVAQACWGSGLTCSIDVAVHRRASDKHDWQLMSNRPHPAWRSMSIKDYALHGRSEMLLAASPAEILRATSALHTAIAK